MTFHQSSCTPATTRVARERKENRETNIREAIRTRWDIYEGHKILSDKRNQELATLDERLSDIVGICHQTFGNYQISATRNTPHLMDGYLI